MMRLIEGFDYLPVSNPNTLLAARGWFFQPSIFGPWSWSTFTGRLGFGKQVGINVLAGGANPAPLLYKPIGSAATTGVIGAGVTIGANHGGKGGLLFYDAAGLAPQVSIAFTASGVVQAWRGFANSGTFLGQSSPGAFVAGSTFMAEAKATIDASAGAVEVKINTNTVLTLSSVDTNATGLSGFDTVGLGGPLSGAIEDWQIDDLYCLDTSGSVNNTYLGNVRVMTQFAAGAGASTQFTPTGAGTNWQAALNFGVDDTKYDACGTAGDLDLYEMQSIVTGSLVHAAQFSGFYRQDDATQVTAHNAYRPGTTTYEGADHLTNTSYTAYSDIVELNPDTGVQFTGAEINATQMGPKVYAI